jgi:DNA polymerase elongation subunit (family B)
MISQEEIKSFLEGNDPEEHIVAIEFDYVTDSIYKIKEIPGTGKVIKKDTFTAFAWVGDLRGLKFYDTSKDLQKQAMTKYGIVIDKLETKGDERLENGLKFLVKSLKGYRSLIQFFRDGGIDPWSERVKDKLMVLPPVEQYLIQREKRLFKGYEEYNDITRLVFDLETTALEPKDGRIFMIGVKTNKGFKKVIECANEDDERKGIVEFFKIIDEIKPSIIGGYNSFNFDWFWIYERCKALNIDIKRICKSLNPQRTISQKDGMLKLANEVERYEQTSIWGYNVIDIIHSVRRAQAINSSIKSAGLKYITQYIEAEAADRVYIPHEEIGSMYAKKEEYWLNLQNGKYKRANKPEFDNLDIRFPNVYVKTTGDDIVERYLDDDLEETLAVDEEFNQGTFLLASMVPTTYERVSTMGTATIWRMIMLAFSYKHNLAIPQKEEKTDFVGGLSRLLKVGYSTEVLKLDYSSLYPSIQLTHDVFPKCDVMGGMKAMLAYFRNARIIYKNLASEWYDKDKKKSLSYDRKQLPIKIFINSMFGALSAPQVFAWGDMYMGEQITCTGRQYLRQMIKFFMKRGYTPLVMDTDGVNFSKPEGWENRRYIGKGLNWKVKEGKEYTGDDADVAEFNDLFMRNEMALDTDGTWPSCINLARKNYAVMESSGKIKLTGNTIKSKKLPLYIEDFIDKGVKQLLEGKGQDFVEWYYEYLTKIYNKEIPLMKIAQRAKVKLSIDDYNKRSKQTTKSGSLMSRQAHMELAIHNKLNVQLGDVIYYVNNGARASHGDVQKVNRPKAGWNDEQIKLFFSDSKISKTSFKEKKEFLLKNGWEQSLSDNNWVPSNSKNKEANNGIPTDLAYRLASTNSAIQLNCYRIDPSDLENNPDMKGDYNVARAITTFNKRIEPLLVVFKEDVRNDLLVTNPDNRGFFTKEQCELINGVPFKSGDQDRLQEDVLDISEAELRYWEKRGIDPNYIYELAAPGWEEYV